MLELYTKNNGNKTGKGVTDLYGKQEDESLAEVLSPSAYSVPP